MGRFNFYLERLRDVDAIMDDWWDIILYGRKDLSRWLCQCTAAPVQNILYTARKLASTTSNVSIYIYGCIGAIYHIAKWIYEVSLPSLKRAGDDEAGEEFAYMWMTGTVGRREDGNRVDFLPRQVTRENGNKRLFTQNIPTVYVFAVAV